MTNKEFMQEALNMAQIAFDNNDVPVGAIVVKDGVIIGRGYNTRNASNRVSGHAEMMALDQACETLDSWCLDNCDIYVTTEPCPMCAGTIQQARIRNVYFGCDNPKAGSFGSVFDLSIVQKLDHYPHIHSGILAEDSEKLMKSFFEKLRNNSTKE